MKIAVIGARGQFGAQVVRAAGAAGFSVAELDREQCDVTDPNSVRRAVAGAAPLDVVVNTAAYHRVDDCESNPAIAAAVNARGAHHAAAAAASVDAAIVYVSTDYVFDGNKREPYVESDQPAPLNVYGATKMAGEAISRLVDQRAYVARIASVFGPTGSRAKGGNFVDRMLASAKAGERPKVVNDLFMSPTSAADAAGLLVELIARTASPGIYHLANEGSCSWYEFANAIFELSGSEKRAEPVGYVEEPGRTRRPRYSALASEKLAEYGLTARPWRAALADYLSIRRDGR